MEKMPVAVDGGGSKRKWKPEKMTMEVYLNFIHSNKKLDLIVDHFNQIVSLHGFKRVAKQQKSVVMEAVNSMELMDPARSTVNVDGVSSDALLSFEEVMKDLSELKWKECCITSLETLNAVVYHHHHQPLQDSPDAFRSGSGFGSTSSTVSSLAEPEKPRRKRRLRKLRDIINDSGDVVSGGSSASCSSPLMAKWVTKKRKMKRTNGGKIGWGGGRGGGKLDDTALALAAKKNWAQQFVQSAEQTSAKGAKKNNCFRFTSTLILAKLP